MNRVTFYTLGCKLNLAETGTLRESFEDRNFDVVPFGEVADVAVINTCSVTEEADRKCRQVIRRALRANPDAFVIVTGCYAQLQPSTIAAIDGVDIVLGASEKFQLFDLIGSFSKQEQTQVEVSCIDNANTFGPAHNTGDRSRAFLKVQDGCDYSCSFCTIPLARGKSRSQSITRTVQQARNIADSGYKEIVLSGINLGLFGLDTGETLLDLFDQLDNLEDINRYRISSIEPNLLSNSIIEFVATSSSFQPHFHIPLQSGDNEILGKMRRRYKRELYADRVNHIKTLMPDACIGVDVIVGFPGETESHFQNTMSFLEALPISYLHVFTYSERPDTIAVQKIASKELTPIPKDDRTRRNHQLRLLSARKRHAFYSKFEGAKRTVLWEESDKNGAMSGFTDNYIKVEQPYQDHKVNTIEQVHLGRVQPNGHMSCQTDEFISIL